MFLNNTLYALVDYDGLAKEKLVNTLAQDIRARGNTIKINETNSFGDVHAFTYNNGKGVVRYIPREFIKYFERISPIADVVANNIIPFPKKDTGVAIIDPDKWIDMLDKVAPNGILNTALVAHMPMHEPARCISNATSGIDYPRIYPSDCYPPKLRAVSQDDIENCAVKWEDLFYCRAENKHIHLEGKSYALGVS